jgi:hypothetical protein
MNLYYMSDPLFEDLKQNFINSIKDKENFNLIEIPIDTPQFDEECPEHCKFGGGFNTWQSKLSGMINGINQTKEGEYFVFSDVDVVVYRPLLSAINQVIKDQDVIFLREFFDDQEKQRLKEYYDKTLDGNYDMQLGNINIGFNVIRSCDKTHRFFSDILKMIVDTGLLEQSLINKTLYSPNDYDLKWDLFPPEFFSTSIGLHHIHNEIKDVVLYHANCAVKKQTKLEYMYHIDSVINRRL